MANGQSALERHFQTGIQVLIISILLWFGDQTMDTAKSVIRLEEQISAIRRDLSVATSDRFTGADAAAMKDIINFKFETLERRLSTIENGS